MWNILPAPPQASGLRRKLTGYIWGGWVPTRRCARVGAAGLRYWECDHSMPRMIEDYRLVIAAAAARPAPAVALPAHLVNNGDHLLNRLLGEVGVAANVWETPGGFKTP